jgi:hypothetical protein
MGAAFRIEGRFSRIYSFLPVYTPFLRRPANNL